MIQTEIKKEIRDMQDGDWYWISRRIFDDYASKIGVVGLACITPILPIRGIRE
jgi:hypothetical protein